MRLSDPSCPKSCAWWLTLDQAGARRRQWVLWLNCTHLCLAQQICSYLSRPKVCTKSGAGVNPNKSGQEDNCIRTSLNIPDMRKAIRSHMSPKISINFDKSTIVHLLIFLILWHGFLGLNMQASNVIFSKCLSVDWKGWSAYHLNSVNSI